MHKCRRVWRNDGNVSSKWAWQWRLSSVKGSAVVNVAISAAMLVFIILPVFAAVMEKYVLMGKSRIIRDAVDMTNISLYNALNAAELGQVRVDMDKPEALDIFREILGLNLKLDDNLEPRQDSVAEGKVEIVSLEIYSGGFPAVCPNGAVIGRPTVHSCVNVPVKPSLYGSVVLKLLGREHIDVFIHVDSEIPLNN